MKHRVAMGVVVTLAAGGCCFGGTGSFDVSGPTTSVGPGFAPDPMILAGSAGGPSQASALDPSCRGYVGIIPSHTLQLSAPMPALRVMALSDADTTLVVRRPDGTYLCNDDSDGLNPAVDLVNAPPGAYNVYVGTYSPGSSAGYQLGLTTNPSITPRTMHAPPVAPPVAPPGGGAPGTVLRTGTATVALVSGNLPGVTPGTTCTYTQTSVDPGQHGFDCRWQVVCGGAVVYGDGEGGFNPCHDPSWPPGTLVADTNTTGSDGDPSLVVNPGGMMVRDDAQGPRGEHQITAMTPVTPVPPG